jgi:Do/DeqQ family serine protease
MNEHEEEALMRSDYIQIGGAQGARTGRRRASVATALLLVGSLGGWMAGGGLESNAAATVPAAPVPVIETLADGSAASYAAVVDRVAPAVVTIRSQRVVRTSTQQLPDHPLFREFFGDRLPRQMPERREGGMGSGVIVRADGYLLTNDHVVAGADQVDVELTDGRTFKAKVVGTDQPSDLAVLKVEAGNLQTLPLGDSDAVRVGDVVLAVGNPLGVGQTVTMGIVSAKGRSTGLGDGSFEDFIQTDAPINRGNSGGALVNTRGELVGINSQILSPSGGNIGIGFSIPAEMAQNVMTQLIDHGEVRRGRLGVTIQHITPELAQGLGLSSVHGALVSDVERGGPAAGAGVQRGDVITALNGETVRDSNELRNEVAQMQPGSDARLTVRRDGSEREITVTLGELAAANRAGSVRQGGGDANAQFGLSIEPLTAERARELGVQAKSGLVIAGVEPGSRAARAGLRAGDVIEQVNRRSVSSVDALREALQRGDRPALLLVHRGETTLFVTLAR